MNEYINGVFQQQDATDSSLSDQEKLFYLFQAYQRIRSPNEWVSYVDSIKADFDRGNAMTPRQLIESVESKYNMLKDESKWKPSDKTVQEEFIAMVNKLKDKKDDKPAGQRQGGGRRNGNGNSNGQERIDFKKLPFKDEQGKEGDTKQFKGKTFYWCEGPPTSMEPDGAYISTLIARTRKRILVMIKTRTRDPAMAPRLLPWPPFSRTLWRAMKSTFKLSPRPFNKSCKNDAPSYGVSCNHFSKYYSVLLYG